MSPVVTVIAPGSMGAAVGGRLAEQGVKVLTSLTGRSPDTIERARVAGLVHAEDKEIAASDFILSIVPPGDAIAVAQRLAPQLTASNRKPVFVECNAISPPTAERIAEVIAPTGSAFVDAGIIGPPPKPKGRDSPRFYASGAHAHLLESLRAHGLNVKVLDAPIGAASAFKLSYAGVTKGLIALGAAMFTAAARCDLSAPLAAELEQSQPGLFAFVRGGTFNMFPKAYRWVAEMEQIAEFLDEAGGGSQIYSGAARVYEQIAADWERDPDGAESIVQLRSFFGK